MVEIINLGHLVKENLQRPTNYCLEAPWSSGFQSPLLTGAYWSRLVKY